MTTVVAPLQYYSEEQTAKMVGISRARLRAWSRAGIASGAASRTQGPSYTFQDLVALRSTKRMVEGGVSLSSIRVGIEKLKKDAPGEISTHCLARHRVLAKAGSWSVTQEGMTVDVLSGQLSFNYEDSSASEPTPCADVLSLPGARRFDPRPCRGPLEPQDQDCAESWFEYGTDCELLWDRESPTDLYFRKAKQAYLKAVDKDEGHARAWTNLATLHATVGDTAVAREYYRVAVASDERLVEPLCNLAELDLREGAFQDAADRFGAILAFEPENLDALYGLARATIALGEHDWGADILRMYCGCIAKLDPSQIDEELEERWQGARMVLSTHEQGYTKSSKTAARSGLEHA